jgi:hypothetical protein
VQKQIHPIRKEQDGRCAVEVVDRLWEFSSKAFGTYMVGVLVHFRRLLERYPSAWRVFYSGHLQLGGQLRRAANTMCCRLTMKIMIMSYVIVMLM